MVKPVWGAKVENGGTFGGAKMVEMGKSPNRPYNVSIGESINDSANESSTLETNFLIHRQIDSMIRRFVGRRVTWRNQLAHQINREINSPIHQRVGGRQKRVRAKNGKRGKMVKPVGGKAEIR